MTDKFEEAKKAAPEKDQWKFAPPYSMHDPKEFKARYEASCHCGKVKYQLSREKPLDSKLCHCTTCQTQHGKFFTLVVLAISMASARPLHIQAPY